jgi:hypothetical protein
MADYLAGTPGGEAWLAERQTTKAAVPPAFHACLVRWLAAGSARAALPPTTFTHVIAYMDSGAVTPRLAIALGDIGYTRDEIDGLAATGQTALDVARAIVARGIDESD